MHTLKITSIGNSAGIILPTELLAKLGAEKGDTLFVTDTPNGIELTQYDAEFSHQMEIGRQVMREDRDVLRLLAQ